MRIPREDLERVGLSALNQCIDDDAGQQIGRRITLDGCERIVRIALVPEDDVGEYVTATRLISSKECII